nr:hypothetical protein [Micromonospora sp. DSM 115978]
MSKHVIRGNRILPKKLEDLLDAKLALRMQLDKKPSPDTSGGKPTAKPGSRPPLDLATLDVISRFDKVVGQLVTIVVRELAVEAAEARKHLQRYLGEVEPDTGAYRAAERAIDSLLVVCRRALNLDGHYRELGLCPTRFQEPVKVAYQDSEAGAELLTDLCCHWDSYESSRQTRRAGRPVEVWERSVLLVDPRADPLTTSGDVFCPSCSTRWPAREWL